ncbi:Rpn family recombination-promoting nuclease/putative transposase [Paludibacterium sp. THUN1379]|nr:Rpn family recombination-promoting nuclease/putative transposase [Paludibacterium sp. THUN1379]
MSVSVITQGRDGMTSPTPHDLLFKQFLHDPDTARDFLRFHLPPNLQRLCDLDSLRLAPGSFVEPGLRSHCCDVLYALQTAGQAGYVYALIEHQSTPDRWMAFRLMRYSLAAMQQHLDQRHHQLPLVIPMLFYHGRRSPYPFSTRWLDLFAEPETATALYQQPFPLIDVTVIDDDTILRHRRMALLELVQKHSRQRDKLMLVRQLGQLLRQGWHTHDQLQALLKYLLSLSKGGLAKDIVQTLVQEAPQQERDIMTAADELRLEGMELGMQQGMEKGRNETRLEMALAMLKDGLDLATVLRYSGLSPQDLQPHLQ